MHEKRIMHRDLKPANIFIAQDDSLKIGDLGLGREFSSGTIEVYSKVGTPLYMSPEVINSHTHTYTYSQIRIPFHRKEKQKQIHTLFNLTNQILSCPYLLKIFLLPCILFGPYENGILTLFVCIEEAIAWRRVRYEERCVEFRMHYLWTLWIQEPIQKWKRENESDGLILKYHQRYIYSIHPMLRIRWM